MSNETEQPQPTSVQYTSEFKRNIRQLVKKYRRIKTDVQPLLHALGQGQTPGDQIPGVPYEVFKVRVRNSDSGKGKSGGYRVIYQRAADHTIVVLVTIYSKTEQADIAPHEIGQIILDYEVELQATPAGTGETSASDSMAGNDTTAESEAAHSSDRVP